MARYRCLSPIDHDNKRYEEGQDIPLSGETAAGLLARGLVEEVKGRAKSEDTKTSEGKEADQGKGGGADPGGDAGKTQG